MKNLLFYKSSNYKKSFYKNVLGNIIKKRFFFRCKQKVCLMRIFFFFLTLFPYIVNGSLKYFSFFFRTKINKCYINVNLKIVTCQSLEQKIIYFYTFLKNIENNEISILHLSSEVNNFRNFLNEYFCVDVLCKKCVSEKIFFSFS